MSGGTGGLSQRRRVLVTLPISKDASEILG